MSAAMTRESAMHLGGGTAKTSGVAGIALEFGGLIVFWLLQWQVGTRAAVLGAIAFILIDGFRRLRAGVRPPKIWVLSSGAALLLGAIDLWSGGSFTARYEASATNLVWAAAFAVGAFGRRSILQEIAEERAGAPFADGRSDLRAFFRAYTLVWAGYFALKSALYLWLGLTMPLGQALMWRTVLGTGSLVVMIAISFKGAALFRLCRRLGLFRAGAEG